MVEALVSPPTEVRLVAIEALDARHGDALLLHLDRAGVERFAMVDGGPPGTFSDVTEPRLTALRGAAPTIVLDFVAVSHVDDDHIAGIVSLFDQLDSGNATIVPSTLVLNTPGPMPAVAVAPAAVAPAGADLDRVLADLLDATTGESFAVVASIRQGSDLLDVVLSHPEISLNPSDGARLVTGSALDVGGLPVQVVCPSQARLQSLFAKWQKAIDGGVVTASAEQRDRSVTNLSSVVLLVGDLPTAALLTGDALEDDILAGLAELGLLGDTPITIDVLKVPHHGSNSAATPKAVAAGRGLLEQVLAKHYLVCADGRFGNPTPSTLVRIVDVNVTRACTVWFTSSTGRPDEFGIAFDAAIQQLRERINETGAPVTLQFPTAATRSVTVPITT